MAEWSGGIDYVYNAKFEVLTRVLDERSGPVCFVDTDTWFLRSPTIIRDRLQDHALVLHQPEYRLVDDLSADEMRVLADEMRSTPATSDETLPPPSTWRMWNSGVIGVRPEHIALVHEAAALSRRVYAAISLRTAEQLALSVVGEARGSVARADDVLKHNWDGFPNPYRRGVSLRQWRRLQIEVVRSEVAGRPWSELLERARAERPWPFYPSGLERIAVGIRKRLER
jgi:hypothetical protein